MARVVNEEHNKILKKRRVDHTHVADEEPKKPKEPEHLKCPISKEMFRLPVVTSAGQTYEFKEIFKWFAHCARRKNPITDPYTKKQLPSHSLIVNWLGRHSVQAFLDDNPDYTPEGWKTRCLPHMYSPCVPFLFQLLDNGDITTISLALEYCSGSVPITSMRYRGLSLLHLAAKLGNTVVVNMLIKEGACVNAAANTVGRETALYFAANNSHMNVVEVLLKNGANDARLSPLHLAAHHENKEIIDFLVQNDSSNVDRKINGQTALHIAAKNGNTDIIKTLLDKNADVNLKNNDKCTALFIATREKHKGAVQLLLDNDAAIDAKNEDDDGKTALDIATENGFTDIVKILLKKGAAIDPKNSDNWNNIHTAVSFGYTEILILLLDKINEYPDAINAKISDKSTTDGADETPLSLAVQYNYHDIVEILLSNGADVNAKGSNNETVLHYAESEDIVKILLDKGANVNAKTKDGYKPSDTLDYRSFSFDTRTRILGGA